MTRMKTVKGFTSGDAIVRTQVQREVRVQQRRVVSVHNVPRSDAPQVPQTPLWKKKEKHDNTKTKPRQIVLLGVARCSNEQHT